MRNDDERSDAWAEIEDLIACVAEKKFGAAMLDVNLATVRAREFAADTIRLICSTFGGQEIYVPKLPNHHRRARDAQLQKKFKGDFKDIAHDIHLSVRQVRNLVSKQKK